MPSPLAYQANGLQASIAPRSHTGYGQLYDHFGYVVQFTHRKKKSDETHVTELGEIPEHCFLCPLYKKGIPCTFNHRMANGKDICDDYSLEIIIKNTGNI